MRPHFVKTAIALIIATSAHVPEAFSADWNGSYSAAGQCFCVGDLPGQTARSIVPTPVGGQTVAQVCRRLGEGPGLVRQKGLFNHTVYEDAQCGNGPGVTTEQTPGSCSGSLDGVGAVGCAPAGPRWDIQAALKRQNAPAVVISSSTDTAAVPMYRSSSLGFMGKPVSTVAARPMKVNRSPAAQAPPEGSQWVIIDGQRYFRARGDMPAAGGEPGQRIVLDGFVYLRDNGKLNPADLFREETQNKPVDADSGSVDGKAAAKQATRNRDSIKAAAAAQLMQREAVARQQRDDARATARQIEMQRRRLRLEKMAALELEARQATDTEELRRAKQQLEAKSASRAQAVLEAHAESRSLAQAKLRQTTSAASDSSHETHSANAELPSIEPAVAAANAASDSVAREQAVLEATRQVVEPAIDTGEAGPVQAPDSSRSTVSSALRLPAAVRASSRNFRYLEALPVRYDVGGDGVMIEGSTSSHSRLQYFGRLGVTRRYNEVMAGGGYYLTPESASRLTFVLLAGIEYGNFELVDGQSPEISVDYDDTGFYLGASSRMVVNERFELKAGIGYSSIFEGDAMFFGGGYLHLTRKLDLVTRFELGDNDLLGIGVRYYY